MNEEIIENIKKYGNKNSNYKPFDNAVCYPLRTQDFVRTGFLEIAPTLSARDYKDPKIVIQKEKEMEPIKIKQATNKGYIELKDGGVFDASYPNSETRRGRVIENGEISPTLTTSEDNLMKIEREHGIHYKIRKLTPLECFRLMGVTDGDAKKMIEVNSSTQCYKQAGNSIVVDVMAAMFRKLF